MPNVTLKVQIGNLSIEVTGESKYAESKLDELSLKYSRACLDNSTNNTPSLTEDTHSYRNKKKISLGEFMKKLKTNKHTTRALYLGYYLEKHSNVESFTTKELADACQLSKLGRFSNISDK